MGIMGLVLEAAWPLNALSPEEDISAVVSIQNLDEIMLQEGGRYVAIYSGSDFMQQVCIVKSTIFGCCPMHPLQERPSRCLLDMQLQACLKNACCWIAAAGGCKLEKLSLAHLQAG